jgi:hypothetical protein
MPIKHELIEWLRQTAAGRMVERAEAFWAAPPPDPWTGEEDEAAQSDDALPLCPRCLKPQEGTDWFCPKCGASVGPYNNLMPFVNTFSIGEVARAGVSDEVRRSSRFTRVGYVLFAVAAYTVMFPVYLFRLVFRWRRTEEGVVETETPEPPPSE